MKAGEWGLAIGMLITGSANTITTEHANEQEAVNSQGVYLKFDHPFVQTAFMFVGEFACFFVFLGLKLRERLKNMKVPDEMSPKYYLIFAGPACCDMCATSLMYWALTLTSPSVFQILRGCVVLFTGTFSVIFLKRKLYAFHWVSLVLVLVGTAVVGLSSVLEGTTTTASNPVLGDALVIIAQLVAATQMVVEEKFISKFKAHPLLVVGAEGFFGLSILSCVLVGMYHIKGDRAGSFENAPDAFLMMHRNKWILLAMLGNVVSIGFFNFFGVSITSKMSAAHRMVFDSVRTLVVWIYSIAIGWERDFKYIWLQLIGFAILLLGTLTYNELLRFPKLYYPPKEQPRLLVVAINAETPKPNYYATNTEGEPLMSKMSEGSRKVG